MHEGPARISKLGTAPLKRGMILSNEPGYYKAGAYGIRIENLVLVTRRQIAGAEKPMNAFETLTFAPIDRRLIEPALMTRRRDRLARRLSRARRRTLDAARRRRDARLARSRHKAAPCLIRTAHAAERTRTRSPTADIPGACSRC